MLILANDGISSKGKEILEQNGFTVITDKVNQEDLIDEVNRRGITAILVRSATTVRKEVIDACPSLRLIGRGGVGMDNIDVDYARSKGVVVVNTPASSSQSVAELVMAQLFSIARFLPDSYKNMEHEDFSVLKKKYAKGIELRGKTLGIIGFGRIGQSLASYALGIGMKVIAYNRTPCSVSIPLEIGSEVVNVEVKTISDLNDLLSVSDFISLHVPKQSNGRAVLGAEEFAKMKDGVRIVNAARGGVIDEQALISALDSGKISAAGLDVYENEPNPNSALLTHPLIACTPHIGAATLEAQDRIGEEIAGLVIEHLSK
jgi:D-3-phosphoglycerate dehydrogenase / 2-oxoglutarate reductase